MVERHGGDYDDGESGWLDVHTGEPRYGSAADEWFAEGEGPRPDDAGCSGYGPDPDL